MKKARSYNIAVIGDTSSGKTMLLFGMILTSKKGLHVVSQDHQEEIDKAREQLQNGKMPDGTLGECVYTLGLRQGGIETPLAFKDYKGGDIENGKSFFDEKIRGEDFSPDGVLFLLNPGQAILNLDSDRGADDSRLSKLTNLVNGIAGGWDDCKCHAIAAAVTAADRISEEGDLYVHRSKFFEIFNRYIVDPLNNSARGIACKTDFEISVTGHVEGQDKLKIIPKNNAADPFLWLIDRIDRRKHPVRYWTRRLWLVFLLALLAAIGCVTWMWQHNRVEDINKEGERIFKKAQTEFRETQVTHLHYSKHVDFLGTSVTNLYTLFTPFPDVREERNVAFTNLLTKYLIATADSAYLKMKDCIEKTKAEPGSDKAYVLRQVHCEIEKPDAFIDYKAAGRSNEVAIAEERLREHREKKVPEVVSEYNEKYFWDRFDMLQTNAAQVASQKYIQGFTNDLVIWKQECSAIPNLSNIIEGISHKIVARCPVWRAAYASNIVQSVKSFEYEVKERPDEIFLFEKKKLGPKLRERLTVEETADQLNLDRAKKGLLKACRKSYFEQERFKKNAEQYPEDSELRDNLTRLLLDTTLTNCVSDWTAELHEKQRQWLLAEIERVQDWIEKAKDYSKFLMRPREGTGDRVHSLLVNCWKWADEKTEDKKKTIFDNDCKKVWEQFIARYFTEKKWKFSDNDNYEYPSAEDNMDDKIGSFLEHTRITDVKGEVSKWLSKMREMQEQWLMDAMRACMEFPDEFDAFDVDGSGEDIKRVLVATKQFADDSISEPNDKKRIDNVGAKRKELIMTMKSKFFEDDKFKSGHEFSIGESGIQVYRSEERKMIDGLQKIFVTGTGDGLEKITNDWSRALLQHERDWLAESQSMCTNGVSKFDGKASTIVDFVARHQGNPFLWDYAMRIKANKNDFGLQLFRDDLKDYAERGGSVYNLEAKFKELQKTASDLSAKASGMNGQYSGLFDIFALRHLCTNCVPSQVGNRFGVNSVKEITAQMKEAAKNLQQDENWLSTEYNIESVEVSLSHPLGVVPYRPRKWNKVQLNRDMFGVSVSTGRVDYVDENFITTATKTVGESEQVESSCIIMKQAVTHKAKMRLFSDLEFNGTLWEEYTRDAQEKGESSRNLEPVGTKKSPMYWAVSVRTPHLRAGISVPVENIFEYASRAGKWKNSNPPTQQAKLSVSVYGNVVGQTPFERIDGCIKKAAVEADDGQNEWRKKFEEAEKRLNELNHILSEEDGSEAEGRN